MEPSLVRAARLSYQFWESVDFGSDVVWQPSENPLVSSRMRMFVHGEAVPDDLQAAQNALEDICVVLAAGPHGYSNEQILQRIPTMSESFAKGMVGLANFMAAQGFEASEDGVWNEEEAMANIEDLRAHAPALAYLLDEPNL
ncbi:MAG: hypothetical protein AB8B83_02790 [Bdellovibrionales bacterium]